MLWAHPLYASCMSAGPGPASTSEANEGSKAGSAQQPSWVRGGGGRGREGGRFRRGVDPIYPVEDPAILQVRSAQQCPAKGPSCMLAPLLARIPMLIHWCTSAAELV